MAKKTRTPPPPRRVQAPKARPAERGRPADGRRLLYLVVFAASGLLALAAVIAWLVFGGSGDGGAGGSVAAKLRAAGCTFQSFPAQSNKSDHSDVPSIDTRPKWNSFPPTSGPHYGQWVIWGAYDTAVPLTMSTHNLEHGGIVIHYGSRVPEGEVAKLREFYQDDPNAMLLAPLPRLGNQIAMSAWYFDMSRRRDRTYRGEGKLAKCTSFDEDAFAEFRDTYRYKGPERIPSDRLDPGE